MKEFSQGTSGVYINCCYFCGSPLGPGVIYLCTTRGCGGVHHPSGGKSQGPCVHGVAYGEIRGIRGGRAKSDWLMNECAPWMHPWKPPPQMNYPQNASFIKIGTFMDWMFVFPPKLHMLKSYSPVALGGGDFGRWSCHRGRTRSSKCPK